MNTRRVRPSEPRTHFAQSTWRNKACILALMGSQATCQQLLRRVSARHLHRAGRMGAEIWRRGPFPRAEAAAVIHNAAIARALTPFHAECVAESIVLWTCLRAAGAPAVVRVGCRDVLGPVEAHMWVELDGETLLDDENERGTWQAFERPWAES